MGQQELAIELGIEGNLFQISERDVMNWMQKGVVVNVHISHWRPYTSLSESDLGIKRNANMVSYIQLGRKKLLPPELISKLESLESKAHETLRKYSFMCPWGKFVPVTTWDRWQEENSVLRAQFFQLRDELVTALPNSVDQLKEIYTQMAEEAYKRLEYNEEAKAGTEFIDNFIANCLSKIPPPEVVAGSFQYNVFYSYVPILEQATAFLESTEEEREMKQEVTRQMNQQKQDMVADFLTEVTVSLRSMIIEACERVQEVMKKNSQLLPNTSKRLQDVLEQVSSLNFYGDSQINDMVKEIRDSLTEYSSGVFIKPEAVTKAIDKVLTTCTQQLEQLESWKPSRFAAIEL